MPHILKSQGAQSLTQAYSGIGYKNAKGNTECVEFIHQTLPAPPTVAWREGKKVTQGLALPPGTAIATFVNGKYPQTGSTGMHAAIYLGQNADGIQVLDQWRAQGQVKPRTIHWRPSKPGLSNDGSAFSVIEW